MIKQLLNPAEDGSILSLEQLDAQLTMESLAVGNIAVQIRQTVPGLVDTATSFLKKFSDKESKLNEVEKSDKIVYGKYRSFLDVMEKHKYMDVAPLRFYIPEGFEGHILAYTLALKASLVHASALVADVLNPFAAFLSRIISSKDAAMRTSKDLAFLAKFDAMRQMHTQEISAFFNPASTNTKTTVGKVVQRNSDWSPIMVALNELHETSLLLKPEVVQKSVNDIVQLLISLKAATASGDLDNASPEVLKTLSKATLSAAQGAEFYSVTIFRAFTLSVIMAQNVEELPKMLSGSK